MWCFFTDCRTPHVPREHSLGSTVHICDSLQVGEKLALPDGQAVGTDGYQCQQAGLVLPHLRVSPAEQARAAPFLQLETHWSFFCLRWVPARGAGPWAAGTWVRAGLWEGSVLFL